MRTADIYRRLAEIRDAALDPDAAHRLEDLLLVDVLRAIAAGEKEPEALAAVALLSLNIRFPRYTS